MPKKKIRFAIIVTFTFACLVAVSAAGDIQWNAGLQVEHLDYDEPQVMNEKGFLAGIFADVTFDMENNVDITWASSFVLGRVDYKTKPETGLDLEARNRDTILCTRIEAGYRHAALSLPVRIFSGFAYRQLTDDLKDIGSLPGYKRTQDYFYIPLGASVDFPAAERWTASGTFEYDLLLRAQHDASFAKLDQNEGFGLRASLLFEYETNSGAIKTFSVEPFVQYWDIERSEINRGFYEPQNTSTIIGFKLSASL